MSSFYKTLFLSIFLVLSSSITFGQELQFLDAKWDALLSKAKAENKMIFVDTYTDWCTYCKVMDKEVFTQKKVANYLNENFLNYKINAEKGEGTKVALQFYLKEYPSYLFLNPDGELVYKTVGFLEGPAFIAEARRAIGYHEKNDLAEMEIEYASKKEDKGFLKKYVRQMDERLGMVKTDLLDSYISVLSEKELLKESNMELLLYNTKYANTKAFDFILSHFDAFEEFYPKMARLLDNAIFNTLDMVAEQNDIDVLKELQVKNKTLIKTTMELFDIETASLERLDKKMELIFHKKAKNKTEYASLAPAYLEMYVRGQTKEKILQTEIEAIKSINDGALTNRKIKTRKGEKIALDATNEGAVIALSDIADAYAELYNEEAKLKQALVWIKKAIELREQPDQYLAYAKIMKKLGAQDEAIVLAKKGLTLSDQINANRLTSYQLEKLDELEAFLENLEADKP